MIPTHPAPISQDPAADLAAWARHRDEAAFRRLIALHGGMVSGVCQRQLDGAAADEAVQAVFIILARKAGSISDPSALGTWLYGVALRVCRHVRRDAARRAKHEREASMNATDQRAAAGAPSEWIELRPQLDDALAALNAGERALVIGHFLEGLPPVAVAARLGLSESTVRRRIALALDKLRAWFSRRGVQVGVGILAAGLASEAQAAGPVLTAACAEAVLHPIAGSGAAALAATSVGGAGVFTAAAGMLAVVTGGAVLGVLGYLVWPSSVKPAPAAPAVATAPPWSAPAYQARWRNGIPASPDFFPIAVWLQHPVHAAAYRQAGVNLFVALPDAPTGPDLLALSVAGMRVICDREPGDPGLRSDPAIVGWMNNTDPPGYVRSDAGCDPLAVTGGYEALRVKDPSRPVCLYLYPSEGVAWNGYPGSGARREYPEANYARYVEGGDILSLEWFPINDRGPEHGDLRVIPREVERLRQRSGHAKPVWCWIETTRITSDSPAVPTPAQVRAEVWLALIHGASGIGYFCHSWTAAGEDSAALLHDPAMIAEVTSINRRITALAPVLNGPEVAIAGELRSVDPTLPIDVTVRRHDGTTYIFAANAHAMPTVAEITVPSAAVVQVLDEDRFLPADGRDRFEPYAVHLYAIRSQP